MTEITAPEGLFAEGETSTQFVPKEDDRLAATSVNVREYAIVKPSGYLQRIGIGSGIGGTIKALTAQAAAYGQVPPVIVSRFVGTTEWFALGGVSIPDELPENFA